MGGWPRYRDGRAGAGAGAVRRARLSLVWTSDAPARLGAFFGNSNAAPLPAFAPAYHGRWSPASSLASACPPRLPKRNRRSRAAGRPGPRGPYTNTLWPQRTTGWRRRRATAQRPSTTRSPAGSSTSLAMRERRILSTARRCCRRKSARRGASRIMTQRRRASSRSLEWSSLRRSSRSRSLRYGMNYAW